MAKESAKKGSGSWISQWQSILGLVLLFLAVGFLIAYLIFFIEQNKKKKVEWYVWMFLGMGAGFIVLGTVFLVWGIMQSGKSRRGKSSDN